MCGKVWGVEGHLEMVGVVCHFVLLVGFSTKRFVDVFLEFLIFLFLVQRRKDSSINFNSKLSDETVGVGDFFLNRYVCVCAIVCKVL